MKKKIKLFICIFFLFGWIVNVCPQTVNKSSSRKIAVTFDDLPFVRMNSYSFTKLKDYFDRLIDDLKTQKVPAIGFVNEAKLYSRDKEDKRKISLLESWLDAGFDLGNHTFSHKSAHEVSLIEFKDDIIKGESITKKLLEGRKKQIQFFRFPSLHTGMTLETKLEIENFFKKHGYKNAPVTIVSKEWLYAAAYAKAYDQHNEELMKKIGESYLEHIGNTIALCEKQSESLFDRDINQILLLHANELNADYFPKICDMLKSIGYEFVSLGEALKDDAYSSKEEYLGRDGISWLDRWAKTRGVDNLLFRGAPTVPAWIVKQANQNY